MVCSHEENKLLNLKVQSNHTFDHYNYNASPQVFLVPKSSNKLAPHSKTSNLLSPRNRQISRLLAPSQKNSTELDFPDVEAISQDV